MFCRGSRRMKTCLVETRVVTQIPKAGMIQDNGLPDQSVKSKPRQMVKLPRYGREGAVEVRPFPAKKRPRASEAQGLSSEAMKGNPTTTTVIPGVDESKSSPQTNRRLGRTAEPQKPNNPT